MSEEVQSIQREIDSITVSKYATKNADEFMAECFVSNKLGNVNTKYVKQIMNIIDSNFKRK